MREAKGKYTGTLTASLSLEPVVSCLLYRVINIFRVTDFTAYFPFMSAKFHFLIKFFYIYHIIII